LKTAIFDLETFTLHADTALLLCAVIHKFDDHEHRPVTVRADSFANWRTRRSDVRPVVRAVTEELADYDIFVAHNGVAFDRALLTSWQTKFGLPTLRFSKFIDPVLLARRHLRLARNSLASCLDFFDIQERKTPIAWNDWKRAAYDGSTTAMNRIVHHCVADVKALEQLYARVRKLTKVIDERGSSY
jgi:uncharacterized protein YprB with RNaseH-like and TPR domain